MVQKVILVAEDDALMRSLVREILVHEGYAVLAATGGIAALRLARTHRGPIDLLLTDVDMPLLDGISAYRRIKDERPGIKVLFMSGAMPDSRSVPPGSPFLCKPFTAAGLHFKVREILDVTSSNDGNGTAMTT